VHPGGDIDADDTGDVDADGAGDAFGKDEGEGLDGMHPTVTCTVVVPGSLIAP